MKFRFGIDNYGLFPMNPDPLQTMQWAMDHGAEGVAFSGLDDASREKFDNKKLQELKSFANDHNLYLEWGNGQHIPRDLSTWEKKDLFNHNLRAAGEAKALGVKLVRSCSGGRMRWNPKSLPTEQLLDEMTEALYAQKQMLMDHGVILAIETHFEFTTFELLRVFQDLGAKPGEWIGICQDTMNVLTMVEDPVRSTERVLPWIVSTHIKDGGILVNQTGFQSFTAPFGKGIVDFGRIYQMLETLPWDINLNIEDHGGDFDIPLFDPEFRKAFPDLTDEEQKNLVGLSEKTKEKMEAGMLAITNRPDWPAICETRMAQDILDLKNDGKTRKIPV
jgi:3-oxoisoapionate decarboxylase